MNNIILIGPSGTGKSTKGKKIAKELGYNFIDFDDDILEKIDLNTSQKICNILNLDKIKPQELVKNTVGHILKILGDDDFLKLENYLGNKLTGVKNTIIATSGSQPISGNSIKNLSETGIIIYLKSDLDNILLRYNRMKTDRIVGMNGKSNNKEKYKQVMESRLETYEKYSDFTYINENLEENKEKATKRNKHGIPILGNGGKIEVDYKKDKQLNLKDFYTFLKKQGIVKL